MRIKNRSIALLLAAMLALPVSPVKAAEPSAAVEVESDELDTGESGENSTEGDESDAAEEAADSTQAADDAEAQDESDTGESGSAETDEDGTGNGGDDKGAEDASEEAVAEDDDSLATDEEENQGETEQASSDGLEQEGPNAEESGAVESDGEEPGEKESNSEESGAVEGDLGVPGSDESDQDGAGSSEADSDAAEAGETDLDESADGNVGLAAMARTIVESGTLETGLSWALDDEGTLTISGTGDMPDYTYSGHAPWYSEKEAISKVVVDGGVTRIGSYAFYACRTLKEAVISEGVKVIGENAFGESGLSELSIPDSVETIEDNAFDRCTSLSVVTLGSGLKKIDWMAFANSALKAVEIPDSVETIGYLAFMGCKSLSAVTLGSGVKDIGRCAFSGSALTAIEIPDSVETIGNRAFAECQSLTSVTIGSGVSDLQGDAFAQCGALKDVVLNGNANYVVRDGIIFTSDGTTLVECLAGNERASYTVPDSVTTIGYAAFSDIYSLREVGLPQNLKEIGGWAFAGTWLHDVSIPAQTEKIGERAFNNACQEVFFYSKNAEIGIYAFFRSYLKPIEVNGAHGYQDVYLPVTIYGFEESTAQKYVEEKKSSGYDNMKFIPIAQSEAEQGLPIGVRYVPYEVSLRNATGYLQEAGYTLADGSLPEGMTLDSDGLIKGTPTEMGRFVFTVQRSNGDSVELTNYLLEIRDNSDVNVEEITDPGYELTELVPDINLSDLDAGGSYTLCSRGDYAEFREVYLDGRLLAKETDYTSEAGSTRVTLMAQTLKGAGEGTHTLGLEFRTSEGSLRRAAQNYTATAAGNSGDNPGSGSNPGPENSPEPGDNPESGNNPAEGNSQESTAVTETSDSVPDETGMITYVVQRGDTLWKIAARFYGSGLLWHRIYQDNAASIRNPNLLRVGQVLKIYPVSGGTEAVQSGTTYTVQAGDTLWKIAARFYGHGSMWERIYLANKNWIKNWNLIFVKQILAIPQ